MRSRTTKPRCTVCMHPDRHRIEMARVAGASFDAIAAKFDDPKHGCKRDAIHRHCRDHLDETARANYLADIPLRELAERANAESVSLLDYLGLIRSTLMQQMLVASGVNDGHRTAVLAGRAVEVLREIGKFTGELRSLAANVTFNTVNILNLPQVALLQAMLLDKLRAYPEARAAVLTGLRELEKTAGGGEHAAIAA